MITVKTWKKLMSFNPITDGVFDVDGTVAILAEVKGKSVEEIENMAADELLPAFLQAVKEANAIVFDKLKNSEGEREVK